MNDLKYLKILHFSGTNLCDLRKYYASFTFSGYAFSRVGKKMLFNSTEVVIFCEERL